MVDRIQTGAVLIKERIVLPESLQIESEPYSKGWRLVSDLDGGGLDRKAREAGWTLFFMAGEENATVIGPDFRKDGMQGRQETPSEYRRGICDKD